MAEQQKAPESLVLTPAQKQQAMNVMMRIEGGRAELKRFAQTLVDYAFGSNTPSTALERVEGVTILGMLKNEQKAEVFTVLAALAEEIVTGEKREIPEGVIHPLRQRDAKALLAKIPGNKEQKLRYCQTLVNFVLGSNTPPQPEIRQLAVELFGDAPSTPDNKKAAYVALKEIIDSLQPRTEKLTDSSVRIVGQSYGSAHVLDEASASDSAIVLSDDLEPKVQKPAKGKTVPPKDDAEFWEAIEADVPGISRPRP